MRIREKTPEELQGQLQRTQEAAARHGVPLTVPAESGEFIRNETWLRTHHPREFFYYRMLLAAQKRGGDAVMPLERYTRVMRSLSAYVETYEKEESTDRRHGTQLKVFRKIYEDLAHGITSGYVRLPTGTGKTVIFTRFVEALRGRTLVVVPKNTLVEQTEEHFTRKNTQVTAEGEEGFEFGVVNKNSKQFDKDVVITTYDSLTAHVKSGKIVPEAFEYLILDEAHFGLSEERKEVIAKFGDAVRLGFTATPKYSDNKHVGQLLEHEFYRMEVGEAIREHLLCGATTSVVPTRVDMSGAGFTERLGYDESALNIPSRNKLALDYYRKRNPKPEGEHAGAPGEKAVVFAAGIDHARDVAQLFLDDGIAAEAVSGEESDTVRQEILARFAEGQTRVLVNAKLLTEGFDDHGVSLCLNLKPTTSVVSAEQRGGRVLRLDDDNPGKIAHIVDFVDEDPDPARRPVLYYEVLGGAAIFPDDAPPSQSERRPSAEGSEQDTEREDPGVIATEEQFYDFFKERHANADIAPRGWLVYWKALGEVAAQVAGLEVPGSDSDRGPLVLGHIAGERALTRWFNDEAQRIALQSDVRFAGDFFGALGSSGRSKTRRTFISPEGMRRLVSPESLVRCREYFLEQWQRSKDEEQRTDIKRQIHGENRALESVLAKLRAYRVSVQRGGPIDEPSMDAYFEAVLAQEEVIQASEFEASRLMVLAREFHMEQPEALKLEAGIRSRIDAARALVQECVAKLDSMTVMEGWAKRDAVLLDLERALGVNRIDVTQTLNRLARQERWREHVADWPDGKKYLSAELRSALEAALIRIRDSGGE